MSIADSAVGMHEVFVSFVDAGFTESQALMLVSRMVRPMCECGGLK